jgi:hypothetical protein
VPAKAKRRIMMTGSIASSAGRSQAPRRRGRIASQNCFQQSSSIVGRKLPAVSMDISINPKDISMTTLNIGKHLVPLEHIVLVEPFDPSTQTRMTPAAGRELRRTARENCGVAGLLAGMIAQWRHNRAVIRFRMRLAR